jgi:hypothetical protein
MAALLLDVGVSNMHSENREAVSDDALGLVRLPGSTGW